MIFYLQAAGQVALIMAGIFVFWFLLTRYDKVLSFWDGIQTTIIFGALAQSIWQPHLSLPRWEPLSGSIMLLKR
jgi:hypothetical protein